ncbi:MAG TPA: response regulator [Geobacter sp.]|nr:response regulator [Geobacter sp.]
MSFVHHTIMLVDNDRDHAHFTQLALQRVGVITPVQVARDGEEAIGYLSGQEPYQDRETYPLPILLLLDLNLPRMSGVAFLSWLRRQPLLRRLPVIVLTQPGPTTDLNRAYELGCNSYLIKPTSFNTLLVMMQGLVHYWLSLNLPPELACDPAGLEHPIVPAGGFGDSRPGSGS